MKHIKQYENFFTDLFKRSDLKSDWFETKPDGLYFWTKDEISYLESLGFEKFVDSSDNVPLFYHPEDKTIIKNIVIVKAAKITNSGHEDWFYQVQVNLIKNDKKIIKAFDTLTEVVNYLKKIIPEEDLSLKKYNL